MKRILHLITITLLLILCNSCGSDKYDFAGVWVNTENKSQLISIKQNGDSYLIEQNKKKYPAQMEGDFLVLNSEQKAVFNKDNANLIINGIEYYRMTGNEFVGKWASYRKKGLLDINQNGDTFNIIWKSRTDMYQVKEYKLKFEEGKLVTDKDSYAKIKISYNNPKSIEIVVDDNPEFAPLKEKLSPTTSTFIVSSASDFLGNYTFDKYSDIPRFEIIETNGNFQFIQYSNHNLASDKVNYKNGKMHSNQGYTLELSDENTLIVDGMQFEGGVNFQVKKQNDESEFFGAWIPEKEIPSINYIKIFRKDKSEYQIFASKNQPNEAPYNFQKIKSSGNKLQSDGDKKITIVKQGDNLKISWDKENLKDILFIKTNWGLTKIKSNLEPTKSEIDDSKPNFYYAINTTVTKTESKAKKEVEKLKNKGYNANYLWIPDYKSLSGAEFYSVYIGPFLTQSECEVETEKYRKIDNKAYALLVSQENKRVEIRGIGKVKIIEPYHK